MDEETKNISRKRKKAENIKPFEDADVPKPKKAHQETEEDGMRRNRIRYNEI